MIAASARVLVVLFGSLIMIATAAADGLASLKWDYRPLLVFAPSADAPSVQRQTALLGAAREGVADRRVAVYAVTPGDVAALLDAPDRVDGAEALRQRFDVPAGAFRVILVGLDGGAKLTSDAPVTVERLFSTIDAMPMRQRTLRERE